MIELTDSDMLRTPGGEYAVLREIRERVLAEMPPSPARHHWPVLAPAQDPWRRPAWDADTLFLALYV